MHWQPVEFLEVRGDVGSSREVTDESGGSVLYGLESLEEINRDS